MSVATARGARLVGRPVGVWLRWPLSAGALTVRRVFMGSSFRVGCSAVGCRLLLGDNPFVVGGQVGARYRARPGGCLGSQAAEAPSREAPVAWAHCVPKAAIGAAR
jgi:hypothetical protein